METIFAVQDIGSAFNGIHQYGVEYHASETAFNRKAALCGAIPSRHGNGWGWQWDVSRVSCEKCCEKIKRVKG